jgi:membrane protein DedA with SNARE-associated domain
MAGVLRMPWKQFFTFNFLGAAVWVTVIASLGYFFGSRWQWLLTRLEIVDVALAAVAVAAVLFLWWRRRRRIS